MTEPQINEDDWRACSRVVVIGTLIMLMIGAASYVTAQFVDAPQAAVNATVAAQLEAVSDRVEKVEAQINYVLMAVVGTLIAQLFQLKAGRK
jgi:hypothetical protein